MAIRKQDLDGLSNVWTPEMLSAAPPGRPVNVKNPRAVGVATPADFRALDKGRVRLPAGHRLHGYPLYGDMEKVRTLVTGLDGREPMTVALLCNGPSLPETWTDDRYADYDMVCGVNTAAWRYKTDIHCLLDGNLWDDPRAIAPVLAYSTHQGLKITPAHARIVPVCYGLKGAKCGMPQAGDCNWTMPCAVNVARAVAAGGRVDIYGFDCALQRGDFMGKGGNRKANRWIREMHWVRTQWGPNCVPLGRAGQPVIDFLNGEVGLKALEKHFGEA